MRKWWYLAGFTVANLIGVGMLLSDITSFRIIGWLWVSFAISFAGLFSVIGAAHRD